MKFLKSLFCKHEYNKLADYQLIVSRYGFVEHTEMIRSYCPRCGNIKNFTELQWKVQLAKQRVDKEYKESNNKLYAGE